MNQLLRLRRRGRARVEEVLTPEVTITLTRADLEIMESYSPVYYTPRLGDAVIGVRIKLSPAARRLLHEGSAPRAERRARRGRKVKEIEP